jgi:hypothetical protein
MTSLTFEEFQAKRQYRAIVDEQFYRYPGYVYASMGIIRADDDGEFAIDGHGWFKTLEDAEHHLYAIWTGTVKRPLPPLASI